MLTPSILTTNLFVYFKKSKTAVQAITRNDFKSSFIPEPSCWSNKNSIELFVFWNYMFIL